MAVYDLVKFQTGAEGAWGTAVAATAKWMGVRNASVNIEQVVHQPEKSGWLYPSSQAAQVMFSASGVVEMDLSYEDLILPLDSVFDAGTPVGTVWTYTAPTDTAVDPTPFTIEIGTPDAVADAEYECAGGLFTELNISGEAGGVWQGSFPFVAEDCDDAAITALTDREVEMIQMAHTVFNMDAWGGAAGTTPVAATLISFNLNVQTGRHLKWFAGSTQPLAWGDTQWRGTLTTVVEFNVASKAIVDALVAPGLIQRAIAIEATGPVSASYAYIDFYGTLTNAVTLFSDRDGNITLELVWTGTYEPTQADWLEIIVDNGLAALP